MEILDYEILTQKLGRPLGGNEYYAVIHFVYVKSENGKKNINLDLGESLGRSSNEAREKMQLKYTAWLESQS